MAATLALNFSDGVNTGSLPFPHHMGSSHATIRSHHLTYCLYILYSSYNRFYTPPAYIPESHVVKKLGINNFCSQSRLSQLATTVTLKPIYGLIPKKITHKQAITSVYPMRKMCNIIRHDMAVGIEKRRDATLSR